MTARQLFAMFLFAIAWSSAQAQFESCDFEEVDHTVSIVESFGWDDLFFEDTPHEDAMQELAEELEEALGDEPTAGYYQIRYYVRTGWFPAMVPITTCLDIEEGESVADAVAGDDENAQDDTGGSGEGGGNDGDEGYDEERDNDDGAFDDDEDYYDDDDDDDWDCTSSDSGGNGEDDEDREIETTCR